MKIQDEATKVDKDSANKNNFQLSTSFVENIIAM
jgi:hypothetical protein